MSVPEQAMWDPPTPPMLPTLPQPSSGPWYLPAPGTPTCSLVRTPNSHCELLPRLGASDCFCSGLKFGGVLEILAEAGSPSHVFSSFLVPLGMVVIFLMMGKEKPLYCAWVRDREGYPYSPPLGNLAPGRREIAHRPPGHGKSCLSSVFCTAPDVTALTAVLACGPVSALAPGANSFLPSRVWRSAPRWKPCCLS